MFFSAQDERLTLYPIIDALSPKDYLMAEKQNPMLLQGTVKVNDVDAPLTFDTGTFNNTLIIGKQLADQLNLATSTSNGKVTLQIGSVKQIVDFIPTPGGGPITANLKISIIISICISLRNKILSHYNGRRYTSNDSSSIRPNNR